MRRFSHEIAMKDNRECTLEEVEKVMDKCKVKDANSFPL